MNKIRSILERTPYGVSFFQYDMVYENPNINDINTIKPGKDGNIEDKINLIKKYLNLSSHYASIWDNSELYLFNSRNNIIWYITHKNDIINNRLNLIEKFKAKKSEIKDQKIDKDSLFYKLFHYYMNHFSQWKNSKHLPIGETGYDYLDKLDIKNLKLKILELKMNPDLIESESPFVQFMINNFDTQIHY